MTIDRLSRRTLLAGLAGGGAATVAGLAVTTGRSRAFTDTMEIQHGEVDGLLLDWRETYNGATLADTTDGSARASPTGPAISLDNVLPGDVGSFSARVRLDAETDADAAVTFALELTGDLASPGLQEYLHAAVWYDTGLAGVDAFGARNAERDPGEGLVTEDAEGTLEDVAAALEDGVVLDASPATPGSACLEGDDAVTVTFGWWFPTEQADINAVQGDRVEFDIRFTAEQC